MKTRGRSVKGIPAAKAVTGATPAGNDGGGGAEADIPADFGTHFPKAGPEVFRLPNERDLRGFTDAEWREILGGK